MIIGTSKLEWNDGIPDRGGYYICLTKRGDIINAFREILHIPDGSGRLHRPACWKLDDTDCGWRECGEKYITAWAEWPIEYDIEDTLECTSCGKDPGEAAEDDDFWFFTCQHCGAELGSGFTKREAEEGCSIRKRLDKEKGE